MDDFQFQLPTKVFFGRGWEQSIVPTLKRYRNVLFHYGGEFIKSSGLYDRITGMLRNNGIPYTELGGVRSQPALSLIYEGIELCRRENVDFILAVGGGSVIDSAKAIGVGLFSRGDVWDVLTGLTPMTDTLPVGVVLTIPASGSESSSSCVVTNYEKQIKKSFNDERIRPALCVIDPELFYTLPPEQIAYGVADMLSHIFERYFTVTEHTDLIDELSEGVMRTILGNAPVLVKDPANYEAWGQIGLSANFAHNNLLGIGRQQSWVCHAMCNVISARYGVPHGAALAIVTPAWMRYVYKDCLRTFVQFAVRVMGVNASLRRPEEVALEGIRRYGEFLKLIGAPSRWSETDVDLSRMEDIAKELTGVAGGREKPLAAGSCRPLYWQDIAAIYRMSL